jgi:hypothetical protein
MQIRVPLIVDGDGSRPDVPEGVGWSLVSEHGDGTVTVELDDAYRQPARDAAARLAVTDRLADLPDHTIAEVSPLFPAWFQPQGAHDAWPEGAIVRHDGTLWRSTTPANVWEPGTSGWHRYGSTPDAGPQPWVQPTGGHDAYPAGATVTHNGRTWENTHGDGNVWEPGVFGWADIAPAT